MLFQGLKDLFFSIFIQSGFLFRVFLPIVKWIRPYTMPAPNHFITDDSGCKLKALKVDGVVYGRFDTNLHTKLKNLRLRETDVLLCGFPKTGCHWAYEIIYMILNNTTELSKHGKIFGGMIEALPTTLLNTLPSPRILNTHVLYQYLPTDIKKFKTKIVFTERNVKDVVVSFYHHHKTLKPMFGDYRGTFNDYFKLFMDGELNCGCFFEYLKKWRFAMVSQTDNDIFVLCYEELKNDPVAMVRKLGRFLGVSVSNDFAEKVLLTSSFHRMREARSGNYMVELFRKGEIGDWENWMTNEQVDQIDKKWEETKSQIEVMKHNVN